jgi:hypothetical protein
LSPFPSPNGEIGANCAICDTNENHFLILFLTFIIKFLKRQQQQAFLIYVARAFSVSFVPLCYAFLLLST